jgi:hypothetical protein
MKKQKVSMFLPPEIARAVKIQAARLGLSVSELIPMMLFQPKEAEKRQKRLVGG